MNIVNHPAAHDRAPTLITHIVTPDSAIKSSVALILFALAAPHLWQFFLAFSRQDQPAD